MPTHETILKYRPVLWLVCLMICLSLTPALMTLAAPKPKPPPEPPTPPAFTVVDLHLSGEALPTQVSMNNDGALAVTYDGAIVVLDSDRELVAIIDLPDEQRLKQVIDAPDNHTISDPHFIRGHIGRDGIISCSVMGDVYQEYAEDGEAQYSGRLYFFIRSFLALPAIDEAGCVVYELVDLGIGVADQDGQGIDHVVSMDFYAMSESGCLVGMIWSETYVDGTTWQGAPGRVQAWRDNIACRIVPLRDDEGLPVEWSVQREGANVLVDLISEPREHMEQINCWAVDNTGRAFLWDNKNKTSYVVLPFSQQQLPLGSASDKFRPSKANDSGLVVGGYDTGKTYMTYFSAFAPCYVQGVADDNGEYVWFKPQKNNTNQLLVKLGTLSGYIDTSVSNVNRAGQMVGSAYSTTTSASRAVIWENGVAVDLNARIDPTLGIVLTSAGRITDNGWILCGGQRNGVIGRFLLLPR